jgi:hypothetical protein
MTEPLKVPPPALRPWAELPPHERAAFLYGGIDQDAYGEWRHRQLARLQHLKDQA